MERFEELIKEYMEDLKDLKNLAQNELKQIKLRRNATLSFSKRKNGYQYYLHYPDNVRRYLKKSEIEVAKNMANKEYLKQIEATVNRQLENIDSFLASYDAIAIEEVYNKLCPAKQVLISPIIQPIDVFKSEWLANHKPYQNTYPFDSIFYTTENGERVRSKSEKILADLFFKYDIPYSYEPEIELSNGRCVYPDFALLNLRTRKTYYWEHLGIIDDGEYASKNLIKIGEYEKSGITIGDNLLLSMESAESPLDLNQIKEKIDKYLK